MLKNISNKNLILAIGILSYITLLILSIVYYKERTVMNDASFQLFSILKNDGFAIQINRFGAAFTQIYPFMASKLGLPLSQVAMTYSASFILFYFSSFLIVLLGFKNEKIALVILLFNTIMVRDSFYWIQCEFVQGVVFTLLFLALFEHILKMENTPYWFHFLSPFFIITIIYFYPLLLFVYLFGLFFFMIQYPKKIKLLILYSLLYLTLFLIKTKLLNNYYDQKSMEGIENIFSKFPNYFQLTSFKNFYSYVVNDYYLLVVFLIINLIYLFFKKQYIHILLMSAFLIGVCFLININYVQGVAQFYLESQYLILMVFVAMPFSYYVLENKNLKTVNILFLILVISFSILRIKVTSKIYVNRLQFVRQLVDQSPTKRIIPKEKIDDKILQFTWGISFEAWLLSTIEHNKTCHIVYEDYQNQFEKEKTNPEIFLTPMGLYPYQELSNQYFKKDINRFYTKY